MQTPFSDLDNAVLLSALEHYGYCPRQCAPHSSGADLR